MKRDAIYYIHILESKISSLEAAGNGEFATEILDECNCLMEIADHLTKAGNATRSDAEALAGQKKRLGRYRKNKRAREGHDILMGLKPLLAKHSPREETSEPESRLVEFHKKLALEDIRDKVEQVAELNVYINSLVRFQGEDIDTISHRIAYNGALNRDSVVQLGAALGRRRDRNRFYNLLLICASILATVLVVYKVVLRV